MLILAILLSAVVSYLLGSFNSSILVVRLWKHKDIRDYGSHNAGLTNTLRCFAKRCSFYRLYCWHFCDIGACVPDLLPF